VWRQHSHTGVYVEGDIQRREDEVELPLVLGRALRVRAVRERASQPLDQRSLGRRMRKPPSPGDPSCGGTVWPGDRAPRHPAPPLERGRSVRPEECLCTPSGRTRGGVDVAESSCAGSRKANRASTMMWSARPPYRSTAMTF
jgi:hypothetical protein